MSDYRHALMQLGLVRSLAEPVQICELADWHRGGSETYLYEFEVRTDREPVHLVAKACVVSPASGPLSEVFAEWLRRRRLLSEHGVEVPKLYTAHAATIVEEYIRFSFIEALALGERAQLLTQLGRTVGVLTNLGFPVLGLHDVRSRGEDVVWVDFGEDLGPAGVVTIATASVLDDALQFLERSLRSVSRDDITAVSRGFEETVST